MLMILYHVMECVHTIAHSHEGGDLGADDLFPLWIYITIHADVAELHSHLHYMDQFATPEENITQLGYCLTTFQGESFPFPHVLSPPLSDPWFPSLCGPCSLCGFESLCDRRVIIHWILPTTTNDSFLSRPLASRYYLLPDVQEARVE